MITLSHANIDTKILINPAHIAAVYESPTHKCTHVVSVGAILPVKETLAQIVELLSNNTKRS